VRNSSLCNFIPKHRILAFDSGGREALARSLRPLFVSAPRRRRSPLIQKVHLPLIAGSLSLLLIMSGKSSKAVSLTGGRYGFTRSHASPLWFILYLSLFVWTLQSYTIARYVVCSTFTLYVNI